MADRLPALILTLCLDNASFACLDALRRVHFPPERNFLDAHITLFHALPGDQEAVIRRDLETVCQLTPVLPLTFPSVRLLGRGVAIEVQSEELMALRAQLAACFADWLTPQDRQRYRPHVTIQNKVTPQAAHTLYLQMQREWQPASGIGMGLLLWQYLGGPWRLVAEYPFLETNLPD